MVSRTAISECVTEAWDMTGVQDMGVWLPQPALESCGVIVHLSQKVIMLFLNPGWHSIVLDGQERLTQFLHLHVNLRAVTFCVSFLTSH